MNKVKDKIIQIIITQTSEIIALTKSGKLYTRYLNSEWKLFCDSPIIEVKKGGDKNENK